MRTISLLMLLSVALCGCAKRGVNSPSLIYRVWTSESEATAFIRFGRTRPTSHA
jgi:hypothetical protein